MNSTIVYQIFEVLLAVVDTMIFFWFFDLMFKEKKRKLVLIITQVIITAIIIVCDYLPALEFLNTIKLFAIIITGFIGIKEGYQLRVKRLIGVYALWFAIMTSSEFFIFAFLGSIFGINSFEVFTTQGSNLRVLVAILTKTIYFFLVVVVSKKIGNPHYRYNSGQMAIMMLETFSNFATSYVAFDLSVKGVSIGILPTYLYSVLAFVNLIALCCSFLLIEKYYVTAEKEKQLIMAQSYVDKQFQHYQAKSDNQALLRNIYHDLKHHFLAMDTLQSQQSDEMKKYMEHINSQLVRSRNFHNTGNSVVDVILQEKLDKAEKEGVEVEAIIEDNALQKYPTIYLCSIFANAIDNAVEACTDVKKGAKLRLRLVRQNEGVHFLIENNFCGKRLKRNDEFLTTKKKKENHGVGLHSIKYAVEQCGGSIVIEIEEELFSMFILLP